MQAFLWRHLVPAESLEVVVFDPSYVPPARRFRPPRPAKPAKPAEAAAGSSTAKPKFTRQQVAGRSRQLGLLFDEGLLSDDFYNRKVAECEASL